MTTAEAAALAGMSVPTFTKNMLRERGKGRDYRMPREQWIDGRTPLWDGTAVESWAKGRKP